MPSKFSSYEEFEAAKKSCQACEVGKACGVVVSSDGNKTDPKVVVIGECPGRDEVLCGSPFVGKSGVLLRKMLNEFGFRKNNALITNVMPCRPLDNKFPSDDSIVSECVKNWLMEELKLLDPDCLLLVGSKALKFVARKSGITALRGTWIKMPEWHREIWCMPTFHPSYIQRMEHMDEGGDISDQFRNDIRSVAVRAGFCKSG